MKTKTKAKRKEAKKVSTESVTVSATKKMSADGISLKVKGRTSRFGDTLTEAKTLKIGEALEVALDKTDFKSLQTTRNWLAQLVKKHVTAPKGGKLVVRTTGDSKLAIICSKE